MLILTKNNIFSERSAKEALNTINVVSWYTADYIAWNCTEISYKFIIIIMYRACKFMHLHIAYQFC